jgi:hypothetical protein
MKTAYEWERILPDTSSPNSINLISDVKAKSTIDFITSITPPPISSSTASDTSPFRSTPPKDSVSDLINHFSSLALNLEAVANRFGNAVIALTGPSSSAPSSSNTPSTRRRIENCLCCNNVQHHRRDCPDFDAAEKSGLVRLNAQDRVTSCLMGEVYPLMIGKGGIKWLAETERIQRPPQPPISTRSITLEDTYAHMGQGTTMRSTLDLENGTRIEEIVDVNVDEKRKANSDNFKRNVRPRAEERSQTAIPASSRSPIEHVPELVDIPDVEMPDEPPIQPCRRHQTQPSPFSPAPAPASTTADIHKFRLASDLSQTVSVSQIGEKIMDAPV